MKEVTLNPEAKAKIASALAEFVQTKSGVQLSLLCTVTEIDTTKNTCYCEPLADYADIQQVRLIPQGDKKGVLFIPKLNTVVSVSFYADGSAYVAQVTEPDKIYITIDNSNKLVYDSTAWVWNDGSLGGMAKVIDLTTKLNNIENKMNAVLLAIGTTWTPVANDGGAALKALFVPPLTTPLTATAQSDIEDTKIKH